MECPEAFFQLEMSEGRREEFKMLTFSCLPGRFIRLGRSFGPHKWMLRTTPPCACMPGGQGTYVSLWTKGTKIPSHQDGGKTMNRQFRVMDGYTTDKMVWCLWTCGVLSELRGNGRKAANSLFWRVWAVVAGSDVTSILSVQA